ncbi:hypothetical protein F4804DRAFT_65179 [Jackrogersella minutella]|nr:hypothetical protein F4804DRAFT_65179 [Jackrogersella minutella]
MAPLMSPLISHLLPRNPEFDSSNTAGVLRAQWTNPSDTFSVLLLLGGDVIGRALAQLTGSGLAPVTFSFGWVAYSVSALLSAMGENKLMPPNPDCRCKVMNGKNGYTRDNSSWILGRIVRDYEFWMDAKITEKTDQVLDKKMEELGLAKRPLIAGLVVSIYKPDETRPPKRVDKDMIYWSGIASMAWQLGIAVIPLGLYGDWGVFIITAAGTWLAMATGLLPQWKREKWASRERSKEPYILTRGNGSQHAVVILGTRHGLNLEDLASGQANVTVNATSFTCIALLMLSVLWILLLITATGLTEHKWYLLAVGLLGIFQNTFAASAARQPRNFGIPLQFVEVFGETKVMQALYAVERKYPGIGRSMRHEFFSNELQPEEYKEWRRFKKISAESNGP